MQRRPPVLLDSGGGYWVGFECMKSAQKLLDADVVGTADEELFDGWDVDDKQALDEVEQFQDIAVVEEEEHR